MGIAAQDKFLERGRRQLIDSTTVFEALPPYADRGINADEEEERPSQQGIYHAVVPDIRGHPALSPSEGDEVEQGIDVGEGVVGIGRSRRCRYVSV